MNPRHVSEFEKKRHASNRSILIYRRNSVRSDPELFGC
jgi:hypothetical protein